MGLFDNYNELEKQLLEHYANIFTVMGIPDAKKSAKGILDKAIEKSKREGTFNLPSNFGGIILKKEKAEESTIEKIAEIFRKTLPQKRAEGIKDGDIEWWWNLNDVERHIMLGVDEFHRIALFINQIKKGKTPEEAGKTVWKFHPTYTYGDPSIKPEKAPSGIKREDYPLPIELKDRVNIWIQKKAGGDVEKIRKEVESFSTMNAFIRKEIKAGKL